MTQPLPHRSGQEPSEAAPPLAPSFPHVAGMGEEEQFTFGVGLVVRAAASLEYTLHGLAGHLLGKKYAYGDKWASDFVGKHITACQTALREQASPIPSSARDSLLVDLEACSRALERRNLFVHCCWQFDDQESYLWWGVKANRDKNAKGHLQVEPAESHEPWELAAELDRLQSKILIWDIEHFGELGDPDLGQPERVSVKRCHSGQEGSPSN